MTYLRKSFCAAKRYVSSKLDEPTKVGTAWRIAAGTLCAGGLVAQALWMSTLECPVAPIPDFLLPYARHNFYTLLGSVIVAEGLNYFVTFSLGAGIYKAYAKQRQANSVRRDMSQLPHVQPDVLQP